VGEAVWHSEYGKSSTVWGQSVNQRTLVDVPATPKLTERQDYALGILTAYGPEGIAPTDLGMAIHSWQGRHPDGRSCDFCAPTGNEVLRALRRKGVARLRRVDGRTFWQATGLPAAPMGDLPEGF
jgi:hypothetical protein